MVPGCSSQDQLGVSEALTSAHLACHVKRLTMVDAIFDCSMAWAFVCSSNQILISLLFLTVLLIPWHAAGTDTGQPWHLQLVNARPLECPDPALRKPDAEVPWF